MDVVRVLLVVTAERVPFSRQRSAPVCRVKCRSTDAASSPPDLRKTLAVILSLLVILPQPSRAVPVCCAQNDCSPTWRDNFIRNIRNPCMPGMDLRKVETHPIVNKTLSILDLVKSFTKVVQQFSSNSGNESRCQDPQGFQELARWNKRLTSVENTDMKGAIEELYRVLAIYTAHGLHVMELGKRVCSCREYSPRREEYLTIMTNNLQHTLCYTLNLENLLGRYFNAQLDFTAATDKAVEVINNLHMVDIESNNRDCSSRVIHDCEVVTNTVAFTTYYYNFVEHLIRRVESTNSSGV